MSDEEELSQEEYTKQLDEGLERVKEAVSNYLQLSRQGSLIVTKLAVVAETYQTEFDGTVESKSLVHFVDSVMSPWELHGMLSMVSKDVWADSRQDSMYFDDDEDD